MATKRPRTNPNQPPDADTDQNPGSETDPGEGARPPRVNPNQPPSQIEQRKALEGVAQSTATTLREKLPDDPDALKDQLVVAIESGDKADEELADLRREVANSRSKLEGYDRLKNQLSQELTATKSKWRPVLGYFSEEYGVDCVGAPIGGGSVAHFAIMFMSEGKPIGVAVTGEKICAVDDGHGRWKLK